MKRIITLITFAASILMAAQLQAAILHYDFFGTFNGHAGTLTGFVELDDTKIASHAFASADLSPVSGVVDWEFVTPSFGTFDSTNSHTTLGSFHHYLLDSVAPPPTTMTDWYVDITSGGHRLRLGTGATGEVNGMILESVALVGTGEFTLQVPEPASLLSFAGLGLCFAAGAAQATETSGIVQPIFKPTNQSPAALAGLFSVDARR